MSPCGRPRRSPAGRDRRAGGMSRARRAPSDAALVRSALSGLRARGRGALRAPLARTPTGRRYSSRAIAPPPRTSPRRRSSPRCARCRASTGAARCGRGCTGSSSTARSTGRARGPLRGEVAAAAVARAGRGRSRRPAASASAGAALVALCRPSSARSSCCATCSSSRPGRSRKLLDLPRGTVNSRLRRGPRRARRRDRAGGAMSDAPAARRAARRRGPTTRRARARAWRVVQAAYRERRARAAGAGAAGRSSAAVAAVLSRSPSRWRPPARPATRWRAGCATSLGAGRQAARPALVRVPGGGPAAGRGGRRGVGRRGRRDAAPARRATRARRGRRAGCSPSRGAGNAAHGGRAGRARALVAVAPRAGGATRAGRRATASGSPTAPGATLRIVNGDGTGDRAVASARPAWRRPGARTSRHVLAYADGRERLRVAGGRLRAACCGGTPPIGDLLQAPVVTGRRAAARAHAAAAAALRPRRPAPRRLAGRP